MKFSRQTALYLTALLVVTADLVRADAVDHRLARALRSASSKNKGKGSKKTRIYDVKDIQSPDGIFRGCVDVKDLTFTFLQDGDECDAHDKLPVQWSDTAFSYALELDDNEQSTDLYQCSPSNAGNSPLVTSRCPDGKIAIGVAWGADGGRTGDPDYLQLVCTDAQVTQTPLDNWMVHFAVDTVPSVPPLVDGGANDRGRVLCPVGLALSGFVNMECGGGRIEGFNLRCTNLETGINTVGDTIDESDRVEGGDAVCPTGYVMSGMGARNDDSADNGADDDDDGFTEISAICIKYSFARNAVA